MGRRGYYDCAIVWVVVCVSVARAQQVPANDHLSMDFLTPKIAAGYSAASERYFQDIDATVEPNIVFIESTVPLYRDFPRNEERFTSYFVFGRGQFSSMNPEISYLHSSHSFYSGTLGLTGGIVTYKNHMYLLTLETGFAEDDRTMHSPEFRPTGSLVGKYQLNQNFAFIYGLSYSFIFDRGLLLPLLGAHSRLSDKWRMHMVLPFSFEVEYEDVPELLFGFVIRANGNQFHFGDDSYFGPQSSPLGLRTKQIQTALSVSFELLENVWIYGEAGMLRNRTLSIGPLHSDLISSKIDNSGYSSVIVKYNIGGAVSWLE